MIQIMNANVGYQIKAYEVPNPAFQVLLWRHQCQHHC